MEVNWLEEYKKIRAYTYEHSDQWEEWMGEDALVYFCSDCACLLEMHEIGGVCYDCEGAHRELWGE